MNEAKVGGEETLSSLGFQTQWYSGSFLNYTLFIGHPLNNFLTCSYSKHADNGFKIEDITFRKFSYFYTMI